MAQNRLSGKIPPELGTLSNLEYLNLTGNRFSGEIPPELGALSNLAELYLEYNQLSGNIPPELASLSRLRRLALSRNQLSGEIPGGLGGLSNLTGLYLSSNWLSGHIPAELSGLSNLGELFLSGNQLTGDIPSELASLSNLGWLNLSHNQLSGKIPSELSSLSNLIHMDLSSNKLGGHIPSELGSLSNLAGLNLGHNHLSGNIPPELGGLPDLGALNLSGNQIDGEIPATLAELANLRSLDLSRNQLTGEIPASFGKLANLTEFWVQGNHLTGCVPFALSRSDSRVSYDSDLRFCFALDDDPTVIVSPSSLTVGEGGTLTINESVLLANDIEAENSTLRIFAVDDAVNGTVSLDGTIIIYRHDGSETPTGSFTYTVTDGSDTDTATVRIAVTPVNDPPMAASDTLMVDEGGTLLIEAPALLANDSDAENDTLRVYAVGDVVNGTGSLDGTIIIYRHDGSETPTGSFTYTVTDGADTDTATVRIAVTPVNDPPMAASDTLMVDEGGTLLIEAPALLANDSDAENDTLRVYAVGDVVNGTASLDGTTIIYRHDGSETPTGSFTYTVTDGSDTDTATVTIAVTPVNDPPMAASDTAVVDEGGTLLIEAPALLANDSDAENDTLRVYAVDDAVNGTASLDGTTIIYRHDGSETPTGSFTYTVTDGADTDTATVRIAVTPVNDPPMAASDTAVVDEGGTLLIEAPALLANDSDAENDTLRVYAVGDVVNGTASLDGTTIIYRHDGSETPTGSFTYTVTDGADTDTTTVRIAVTPVNDPPMAASDTAVVDEGGTLLIEAPALLANDPDAENDTLRVYAVDDAVNGTVSLDGTTITYRHDGSETPTGSFTYTVTDGADTDTTTVTIAVTPVNDPPVAASDTAMVDEGGTLLIEAPALLANDSDAENDTLRVYAVDDAVNGTVSLDGTTIIYRHDGSETPTGSFTYTVTDGSDTDTATVTIAVTPVNDPPMAASDTLMVDEGGTLLIEAPALLANDSDAENDTLRVYAVGDVVNGTASLDGTTIIYRHDGSETPTGSFTYTVTDGAGTDTTTVTITVKPVRDLPVVLLIALALGAGLVTVMVLVTIRVRRPRERR